MKLMVHRAHCAQAVFDGTHAHRAHEESDES